MLWLPILVAFVPAAIMFILPPRWAIAWMALLWAAYFAMRSQIDLTDDPALIEYAMVFGFFLPVNGLATICRLFVIIAEWNERRNSYD